MRILWLSPWLRPLARVWTEGLQSHGAYVLLITADLHPESDTARGYELVLRGRPVPNADWIAILKAYRIAKQFRPDVVVTELLRDPRWRIFGGLAPRVCLIHDDQPHDETHREPWWVRSFEPWDARADATVVFSEYVAQKLHDAIRTRPPTFVAPLMSDLDPSLVPLVVPAGQRKNFVLAGRQRPYKNHSIVFAAWEAHTMGGGWKGDDLILIGDGDISAPIPPHTHWSRGPYRYRDVVPRLASAKASVVHLRSASQSGVQLMSFQLGVPPIVSTAGALPEYQPRGLPVVGIDDIEGLRQAFDTLADTDEVATQSEIALNHFSTRFSTQIGARRLLTIFDRVVIQR